MCTTIAALLCACRRFVTRRPAALHRRSRHLRCGRSPHAPTGCTNGRAFSLSAGIFAASSLRSGDRRCGGRQFRVDRAVLFAPRRCGKMPKRRVGRCVTAHRVECVPIIGTHGKPRITRCSIVHPRADRCNVSEKFGRKFASKVIGGDCHVVGLNSVPLIAAFVRGPGLHLAGHGVPIGFHPHRELLDFVRCPVVHTCRRWSRKKVEMRNVFRCPFFIMEWLRHVHATSGPGPDPTSTLSRAVVPSRPAPPTRMIFRIQARKPVRFVLQALPVAREASGHAPGMERTRWRHRLVVGRFCRCACRRLRQFGLHRFRCACSCSPATSVLAKIRRARAGTRLRVKKIA